MPKKRDDEELEPVSEEPLEDAPLEDEPDGAEAGAAIESIEDVELEAEKPTVPDARDEQIRAQQERIERLERMTAGGGYREVSPAETDDLGIDPGMIAALQASEDPRDRALAKLVLRTTEAERKVAMIEEAQELGATAVELRQMRNLIDSGHAGSMKAAKLILRGIQAERAEQGGSKAPRHEEPVLPGAKPGAKTPPSREVLAEAARRAAALRRSPGATGGARVPEGEGGQAPPQGEGEESGVRFVKASTWKRNLAGPRGREWLRAERAGRVRVTPD